VEAENNVATFPAAASQQLTTVSECQALQHNAAQCVASADASTKASHTLHWQAKRLAEKSISEMACASIGANFHRTVVATAPGEKLLSGYWTCRTISSLFFCAENYIST